VILGAGTAGRSAARQALASGAHVIVLDADIHKLQTAHREFIGRVGTAVPSRPRLEQYTRIADVLVGAVLIPGARAPFVVTEEMVTEMKPGSVILDLSIDQGGCVETSRPTTLRDPVFVAHGVLHYCVPNMTANIPRTASRALANTALPYVSELAGRGLVATLRQDPGLAAGVYLYRGRMVHASVGEALGLPVTPLGDLLRKDESR
jgi:alanine dehydrogenase